MSSPPRRADPRHGHARQVTHWRVSKPPRREPIDRLGWALIGLVGGVLTLALVVSLLVRELG